MSLSGFSASSTAEEVTLRIDGSGLTAIVTGATSGIGTETARVLALRGVHVIMAVRNMNAAKDVKEAILKEIPTAKLDAMELDLSSMASVRKFVSEFNSSGLPLNILINNAGIWGIPFALSKDNFELQFATNHLEEVTQGIDGTGLTAIVTGTTNGIGTETARVLALRGVHVIMAVRNMSAAKDVKEAILKEIPTAKVDAMELDLSSLASVRKFVSEFKSSGLPLNILINNAGINARPFTLTEDNIELTFATNHVGQFLLTNLLLDTMKKTAHESKKEGRIVNVSSDGHEFTYPEGIRFDKINDQSSYYSWHAYGQSKLANILHTNELARRLKEDGVDITANSLHPGCIITNIYHPELHGSVPNELLSLLGKFVLKTIQQGAATTCYVALNPKVRGISGKYFIDSNLAEPSSHGTNTDLAKKLWDVSMKMIE